MKFLWLFFSCLDLLFIDIFGVFLILLFSTCNKQEENNENLFNIFQNFYRNETSDLF